MNCILLAGKNGDIINILPVLHSQFCKTGKRSNIVVAKEYAPLLASLDYVQAHVFHGHWTDFRSAYAYAKKNFDRVQVAQVHGNDIQFAHVTPSVMLDSWLRVDRLYQWDELPLVIPRLPYPTDKDKSIFYADHSQSSPFFHKEELHKLIAETFPTHKIVRASTLRLKSLMDFLPFMDRADLIVSVETAFLHLSAASKTPTIAMVTNLPTHWHGSPWSKRFEFHCRYNDFESRKVELLAAMNRAVNGFTAVTPMIQKTARSCGYNMTIAAHKGVHPLSIYRYHPDPFDWKTKLAIEDMDTASDIVFPKECDGLSMEDPRAFELNGKTHIAYVCSRGAGNIWNNIQAYGPLEEIDGAWRVTKHIVPIYSGNDFNGNQKNWAPFAHNGKLYFIFGNLVKTGEQLIIQMDGDKVVSELKSPSPSWAWGGIRGGAVVPYKNMLVRFFHSRSGEGRKNYDFRYHVGASIMETEAPFKTTMVSSFPILSGNEKYSHGCSHWKPNCALPYGAMINGDNFRVSVGLNDCECGILNLKWSDLNL